MENEFKYRLRDMLQARGLSAVEFQEMVFKQTGYWWDRGRVSLLINGKKANWTMQVALIISQTLGVPIDEIYTYKLKKGPYIRPIDSKRD